MFVCANCHIALKRVQLGVTIVEMFSRPPRPYKLWKADVLQCPRCKHEIVQSAQHPYAEHFQDEFDEALDEAQQGVYVHAFERLEDANYFVGDPEELFV